MNKKTQQVEEYVQGAMGNIVAHDFTHADRVRTWALHIAKQEGFEDLEIVEIAALLHDIGRAQTKEWRKHGEVGAEMAADFLKTHNMFTPEQRDDVCNAIRYHNKNREGEGALLNIVRDADIMDLLGAVGIMRAYTSHASKPEYDPTHVKGETWQMSNRDFDKRFDSGVGIGEFIIDYINFQISCFDNLHTEAAKHLAKPLVQFMRNFVQQLETEIH